MTKPTLKEQPDFTRRAVLVGLGTTAVAATALPGKAEGQARSTCIIKDPNNPHFGKPAVANTLPGDRKTELDCNGKTVYVTGAQTGSNPITGAPPGKRTTRSEGDGDTRPNWVKHLRGFGPRR